MKERFRAHKRKLVSAVWKAAAVSTAAAALCLLFLWSGQRKQNRDLMAEQAGLQEQNQRLEAEIQALTTKKGGIEEHGRLRVKGTRLYDQHGDPVALRGLSSHGIAWYPEYTNYQALETLKDYGASAFRIAMYVEQNDGYLEEPELNTKLLYSAIENSLAADLYTIVDWHVLRDEDPNHYLEEAVSELEKVAERYGNHPGILYEICNEPNGDTTYEDIAAYAARVIPAIRSHAPDALILVGTPDFCTSLSGAIEDPLPYENLLYTYHYYAGVSDCAFAVKEIGRGIRSGLPVFVSEWGLDSRGAEEEHWEETRVFLDFLEGNQIGWISWSLSNKDEGYSMIRPDCTKLHGWTQDELTDTGRFVLQYLSGKRE